MFGVQWQTGTDGGDIGVVVNKRIDPDDIDAYAMPALNEGLIEAAAQQMRQDDRHFRMFRFTYSLYERAWSLMGMEDLLFCMVAEPGTVEKLLARITEYNLQVLDAILPHDFEGVYFGDDWGKQKGMIMGPEHWRKYIKPCMKQMFEKVRSKGKYVLLHSCGDIEEVFPDLIEIGLHAYNTVQPEIYDLGKIKKEYGSDLAFWGAVSTQQFLPHATPAEVKQKSIETLDTLGKNGGYIFSPTHAVTPDIPVENIIAMTEAVQNFRW
jgi:uroporphyrinogen decarboxylase